MAEGLGVGDNTRALVMTRGLAELMRLGVAMGGQATTFAGLAGMGDLIATCLSPASRNRSVGEKLGRGMSVAEITGGMTIYGVVTGSVDPTEAYRGLGPTPGHENEPG